MSHHGGHAVFITGASRVIGKVIALLFARAGASFIGLGRLGEFDDIDAEIDRVA
jgi:NAD(P)-dependent dehydrogenase (short-subunit alcohol dehydrogenase family)